jgi:uncharacterized membrane protein
MGDDIRGELTGEGMLAAGPIHKLVVEFDSNRFKGEILPELDRLKDLGIIRVIDLIAVRKDGQGRLAVISASDLGLDEAREFGAMVGALIGLGAAGREGAAEGAIVGARALEDGHLFDAADAPRLAALIPENSSIAIALLEHRWAIPLREAIQRAGGSVVDDAWLGAEDLIAIGLRSTAAGNGGGAHAVEGS